MGAVIHFERHPLEILGVDSGQDEVTVRIQHSETKEWWENSAYVAKGGKVTNSQAQTVLSDFDRCGVPLTQDDRKVIQIGLAAIS